MSKQLSSSEWVKVLTVSCAQESTKPTFEVTWDTTDSPPGRKFMIGLFERSEDIPLDVTDAIRGDEGTIMASKALDQSTAYDIRVTQWNSGNPGFWPESGPPALFVAPTDLKTINGGKEVVSSWSNPQAGTTPTGGCLYVVVSGHEYTFELNGSGGAIDISGIPLDPSEQVTVYVRPTHGVSTGPASSPVTLVLETYEVILIDNSGSDPRTLRVEGFQQGNARTFDAVLLANGGPAQSFEGLHEDGQGNITINLNKHPVAGALYQLMARLVKPGSLGPLGQPAAMVVAPIVVDLITYTPGQQNDTVGYALQLAPGEPFVSGAQITVQETNSMTVVSRKVVTGSSGAIQVDHLAGDQNYNVTLRPVLGLPGGLSLGPAAALTPPLLTFAPAISSASYDGSVVKAEWSVSNQAGVAGYELELVIADAVIASAQFPSTQGAIAFQADRSLPYQLRVRALGSASRGAASHAPATLITGAPAVTGASTDPVAGTTKASWTVLDGATGYLVQLYIEGLPSGQPVSVQGTDYTLPQPLAPDADIAIAVAAVMSASGVTVTGPLSEPFRLPTTQPALLELDYDGESAEVSWSPATGATGYIISVIANGASQPLYQAGAPATATRARFNPGIQDNAQTYSVVIQAKVNGNTGPPTAPAPLFQPSFFVSTQQATASYPHVFPATSLALSPADTTIYLPDLGGGMPLQELPPPVGPFTLARNTDPNTNNVFPYVLTIPASSKAWEFSTEPIRVQLQKDFVDFLKAAEQAGVVPQGIATIQQAISRYMPQTFQEILYYAYGLDLLRGWADLRPGMILRVAFNNFMSVAGSPIPQWLNGYTGGAVLDYEIGSYLSPQGGWAVGFDAFIAQLVSNGVVQVNAPLSSVPQKTEAGLADAADLFYAAFREPFYRLFFPSTLQTPTGIGSVVTTNNFVIASAPTYTTLTSTVNYPTASNYIAYFRGRAVVKLCIRITVNGVDEVVPIGTTIGNILDRYGRQPPSAPVRLEGLRLERALGPVVLDASSSYSAGRSYQVRVSWGSLAVYGPARNALSLPLMHGDRLTIAG